MTGKKTTIKNPVLIQARREQILEAARRCFEEKGFHQSSLHDIAREFGMSVGHIYNYFDSKDDIIEAMVAKQTQCLMEMIRSGVLVHGPYDQMRTNMERVVDMFMAPDTAHLAAAITGEALINPRVRKIVVEASTTIREVLLEELESLGERSLHGVIPREVAEARIVTFRAMLEGLRYVKLFNPNVDFELLRRTAVDELLKMCTARCDEEQKKTEE